MMCYLDLRWSNVPMGFSMEKNMVFLCFPKQFQQNLRFEQLTYFESTTIPFYIKISTNLNKIIQNSTCTLATFALGSYVLGP